MARKKAWDMGSVVDALFKFRKERKRWPSGNYEWRTANGLPSPWTTRKLTNPRYVNWQVSDGPWYNRPPWRRPWDVLQVEIAKDERCDGQMAFQLPNALARKEAIQRIGFKNLIKELDTQARCISTHPRFGELWDLPGERTDTRMRIVKVINQTAEPDGTFAEYFLRVPPHIMDAQRAVAWTFDLDKRRWEYDGQGRRRWRYETEYRPLVET